MVVYSPSGKVVAGDATKVHTVTEYVVFERWIKEQGEGAWMIAGKVSPSPGARVVGAVSSPSDAPAS